MNGVKNSLSFLLYGFFSILGMAGLLAIDQVKLFIDQHQFIVIAISIAGAAITPKLLEKVPV